MPFVLDASTTAAWCFPDETSSSADQALDHLSNDNAFAPQIWWAEIRNILIVSERRGRIDPQDSGRFLSDLSRLPIAIDNDAQESAVLDLARRYSLTVYDALYLELALRHALPLATLDKRLASACEQSGGAVLSG
jgi:predicted nucleic acid-binding protein